jgi:GNAT superfamily N-acetyltransferase
MGLPGTGGGGSMGGMVTVREVGADQWEAVRDARLAALKEAPYAFGSSYAREAPFTREQWLGRLERPDAVTFLARLPDLAEPAGLAGALEEDGMVDIVSMWVRPAARGGGVGAALVSAAADWARARDHDTLYLWVTETNAPARLLYERCGFTPTGESQQLPSDPSLAEIRMRRRL